MTRSAWSSAGTSSVREQRPSTSVEQLTLEAPGPQLAGARSQLLALGLQDTARWGPHERVVSHLHSERIDPLPQGVITHSFDCEAGFASHSGLSSIGLGGRRGEESRLPRRPLALGHAVFYTMLLLFMPLGWGRRAGLALRTTETLGVML